MIAVVTFRAKNTFIASLRWTENWSARILEDKLFLSATRTVNGTGQELRDAIDKGRYSICGHVDMAMVSALHPSTLSTGLFVPCRDAIESCNRCLTDYTTTAEQRFINIKDGKLNLTRACWLITVTSYHRLGSGRSPLDVKWHALATRGIRDLRTTPRDMIRYPQGTVREVWKEGEKA
ncbi:hypothetical protein B0T24DRAFT_613323 [Lasiosphaeria ovina]|uniref:Uncharacterized protein n=1 Tax=Lasiosphaeria ovina TaxID=92902 RepID=A0AAE0NE79_9PEZI|nr:hypothetical protein B0T24DRAFT_613323 [Lasiosphaeria ovina]